MLVAVVMSNGLNTVALFGNLGSDPELKQTDSGSVLKLRLATNRTWIDKEEKKQERTDWHNVTVFGKRAEALARLLTKGMTVAVQGRLETSSYEKDGQKRYWTAVVADEIGFSGGPGRTNGAYTRAPAPAAEMASSDLPF